jgi:hypothetical protein
VTTAGAQQPQNPERPRPSSATNDDAPGVQATRVHEKLWSGSQTKLVWFEMLILVALRGIEPLFEP